jgi:ribosome-binding factor A
MLVHDALESQKAAIHATFLRRIGWKSFTQLPQIRFMRDRGTEFRLTTESLLDDIEAKLIK